jgi:hypothetical protein
MNLQHTSAQTQTRALFIRDRPSKFSLGDTHILCQFAAHQRQPSCRSAPLSPYFGRDALQTAELATAGPSFWQSSTTQL